jgi:hypothetical protein
MDTRDDFPPDDRFPLFLSEHADEAEQQGIGEGLNRAVISSLILKTSILVVTATGIAIGIAFLSVGNPVAFFANLTASLVDISALQPGTDQSTPTIQPTADAQALPPATSDATPATSDAPPVTSDAPPVNPGANPESALLDDKAALRPPTSGSPTATDAPTRNEIAAASEPTDQSQTKNRQPSADALFKEFQAWAAERVQRDRDAPARVVQDARPQVRSMQKHRQVQPAQNPRAEIRPERHPRAKIRREQDARVQVPPVTDARAQDQSVQNAQSPWLLQRMGLMN